MKKYGWLWVGIVLLGGIGCSKESGSGGSNNSSISVGFSSTSLSIAEEELDAVLKVQLSEVSESNISITVEVTSDADDLASQLRTVPTSSQGSLTMVIESGQIEGEILLSSFADVDVASDIATFKIVSASGANIGNADEATVSIDDATLQSPQYLDCLPQTSNDTLEIASWNIKRFPQTGNTLDALIQMIPLIDVDIIAVQEISNASSFEMIGERLPGWKTKWLDINGDIELGFIYKESEITSISEVTPLFTDDFSPFPREAAVVDVTHVSGVSAKLMNIHLKCCSEGSDRRAVASTKMKEYIDSNLSDDKVIVIGDFNDLITGTNPFSNFINDSDRYFFADADIAAGSQENWSFPSWPSHIDHILCSNELASNFINAEVIKIDDCVVGYPATISDHRPLIARFK